VLATCFFSFWLCTPTFLLSFPYLCPAFVLSFKNRKIPPSEVTCLCFVTYLATCNHAAALCAFCNVGKWTQVIALYIVVFICSRNTSRYLWSFVSSYLLQNRLESIVLNLCRYYHSCSICELFSLFRLLSPPPSPTHNKHCLISVMFNIPVGVCFSSHKKSVTANSVSLDLEIWATSFGLLWPSSGSPKNMNTETLLWEREGLPLHSGVKIYTVYIQDIYNKIYKIYTVVYILIPLWRGRPSHLKYIQYI
jgi:hypothetical protein